MAYTLEGAFTPGCQAYHLPPYIQKFDELKSKGVDIVAVIASNDAFVMNGTTTALNIWNMRTHC